MNLKSKLAIEKMKVEKAVSQAIRINNKGNRLRRFI